MAPSPSPQAVAPATTPLSARPEVRGRRRGGMGLSEGGEGGRWGREARMRKGSYGTVERGLVRKGREEG